MRLNSKLKAACLAGVAVVTTLAAGEALAGVVSSRSMVSKSPVHPKSCAAAVDRR